MEVVTDGALRLHFVWTGPRFPYHCRLAVESALAELSELMSGSPGEALTEYTVMYLKEQMAFEKTGQYSNTDFGGKKKFKK